MHYKAIKSFLIVGCVLGLIFVAGSSSAEQKPASSIPTTALIQPADLASTLGNASAQKPLLLHVGFRKLFTQAHIPGSEYVGPTSDVAGLQLLKGRVAKLTKSTPIVIYCGCCPWSHCPNIAAAYDALHEQGFTNVKALYISQDFGTDWVSRGYPVAKGE